MRRVPAVQVKNLKNVTENRFSLLFSQYFPIVIPLTILEKTKGELAGLALLLSFITLIAQSICIVLPTLSLSPSRLITYFPGEVLTIKSRSAVEI